jgi:hypothetical protein
LDLGTDLQLKKAGDKDIDDIRTLMEEVRGNDVEPAQWWFKPRVCDTRVLGV